MKKFVLLTYQGPTPPIPGTDWWKALSEAEQKSIYADSDPDRLGQVIERA
jgi:hypothetical protein